MKKWCSINRKITHRQLKRSNNFVTEGPRLLKRDEIYDEAEERFTNWKMIEGIKTWKLTL